MFTKKMQDAINAQIKEEFYSSHLYLAMSAYAESKTYKGFATWLRIQAEEERIHALKLYDFMLERSGMVELTSLDQPPVEFGSLVQMFEKVLAHEEHITSRIHDLYRLAESEKDLPAKMLLQWFVNEQVEEEANASEILDKLKMVGDRIEGILYLDTEYGQRPAVSAEASSET